VTSIKVLVECSNDNMFA